MKQKFLNIASILFLTLCPGFFALSVYRLTQDEPAEQIALFLLVTSYVFITQVCIGYILTISLVRHIMLQQAEVGSVENHYQHLRKFDSLTNGTCALGLFMLTWFFIGVAFNPALAFMSLIIGGASGIMAFIAFNWQSKINVSFLFSLE